MKFKNIERFGCIVARNYFGKDLTKDNIKVHVSLFRVSWRKNLIAKC